MKISQNIYKSLFSIVFIFAFGLSAQDQNEESVEEVVVTGSYLKGSATDGASPIEVIERSTIEDIGAVTVADITNYLTANSGSENNADSFNSGSTQGTSNVNLRGLGLSSTLVLINGRRNTVAASQANDGSVFVDTNSIPTVAIQRVERLKKNAPGIYVDEKKIASIGLRLKKGYTYHGLSLNVNMNLDPFLDIDPCGYKGLKMSQLEDYLPKVSQSEVEKEVLEQFKFFLGQ